MNDIRYVALSGVLTWLMVMTTASLRGRAWEPGGVKYAFGNRDEERPASPIAGRAERATKNMFENMIVFVALWAAARAANAPSDTVTLGAAIFFWARLAYFVAYVAGVRYLRSFLWSVAVAGMGLVGLGALR